jgi:hypothetical protein
MRSIVMNGSFPQPTHLVPIIFGTQVEIQSMQEQGQCHGIAVEKQYKCYLEPRSRRGPSRVRNPPVHPDEGRSQRIVG